MDRVCVLFCFATCAEYRLKMCLVLKDGIRTATRIVVLNMKLWTVFVAVSVLQHVLNMNGTILKP